MLQTVAQGRVAGQEDISKRSLLTDRLPSCTCEGGKDATCPCSDGCCRFETCYPGQTCGSTDASSAASTPTTDCGVLQQTAVAAGCSLSLLQHTIPGGGMASKTAGAATSATTAAVSDTASAATDTVGAATSATTAAVSDTAGAASETVGAASSATEAAGNAAVSASSSYASIEQTAMAAGCSLSLLQEVIAHNHSERALLNERLPSCKCPGGKSAKCGCNNKDGGVGCCQWETCYPTKTCGPVPGSDASASGSSSGTAVADNTACCESLQQSAAAAGCSGPSLLQEQLPDDEEYENKKNDAKSKADAKKDEAEDKKDDAKSKADAKKDDAKSNAENKKDDAKSKADTKKAEAEDKKDDAKSKAENKKDDAKSKAEAKKESELDRW